MKTAAENSTLMLKAFIVQPLCERWTIWGPELSEAELLLVPDALFSHIHHLKNLKGCVKGQSVDFYGSTVINVILIERLHTKAERAC